MPINIPNLDDRNYDQFYSEAMSVITRYYPDYAGIGPSDPAMALVELFCYYFDITSYQLNRVSPETRRNFAALMGIDKGNEPPKEAIGKALAELSAVKRAVTAADIETIIKRETTVARVCVLYGERLRVNIVAKGTAKNEAELGLIYRLLRACSPLGTRYEVRYAPVMEFDVYAVVAKKKDSTQSDSNLAAAVEGRLNDHFDRLKGGSDGKGWEFGRAVSLSEVYGLISGVAGVDHVPSLMINKTGEEYCGKDELLPEQGGLVKINAMSVTVR
ncbi:MAG: hypothetical protein FWG06_00025 [Clostridiales bacterium]|nr:hypothetical protein [Clostridiales bacterium]